MKRRRRGRIKANAAARLLSFGLFWDMDSLSSSPRPQKLISSSSICLSYSASHPSVAARTWTSPAWSHLLPDEMCFCAEIWQDNTLGWINKMILVIQSWVNLVYNWTFTFKRHRILQNTWSWDSMGVIKHCIIGLLQRIDVHTHKSQKLWLYLLIFGVCWLFSTTGSI